MKKIGLFILVLAIGGISFSQTDTSSLNLFPAIWEVVLNNETGSVPYKATVLKSDVFTETYQVSFIQYQKVLRMNQAVKWDAIYSLNNDGSVSCKVSGMQSAGIDSKGNPETAWRANSTSSMTKMADSLAERAKNVLANQGVYEKYKEKALTDPVFLYNIFSKTPNALWAKKFIEKNEIIGKQAEVKVFIVNIDENKGIIGKETNKYAYVIGGIVLLSENKGDVLLVTYYTNDESTLSLKTDDSYLIKGKIAELNINSLNILSSIRVVSE